MQPCVREERCATCEYLQGALVELRLALEDLPADPERARLLAAVGQAMRPGTPHACLGCRPCNPGDILADFYRQQQAQASVARPCCDAG